MKLLLLQDAALTHLDVRFRQSPLALLIPSLIFFSITAVIVYHYWFGELPLCAAIPSGGFTLIFGLMVFSSFRKSLAPTNWFLAIGPDRVLVKFRSYLNAHFPAEDPQGVTIEYPQKEVIDLTVRGRSNLKSAEDKILYLAERGNLIAATKLARRTYKLSLAEAKQFVEDLLK